MLPVVSSPRGVDPTLTLTSKPDLTSDVGVGGLVEAALPSDALRDLPAFLYEGPLPQNEICHIFFVILTIKPLVYFFSSCCRRGL